MKNYVWLFGIFLFFSCASKQEGNPHVEIVTQFGAIELELLADKAPKTVSAFLRNIDSGWYDKSSFYRILSLDNQPMDAFKSELIQGGIWQTNYDLAKNVAGTEHESTQQTGILHKLGTISMARNEPGSAKCEFFICIDDEPGFDFGGKNNADGLGYSAFGRVVKGMDVALKVYNQSEHNQRFNPPVVIFEINKL